MKKFRKVEILSCVFCGENQEYPAIDYIAYVPNFGGGPTTHNHSVHSEQCCHCDQKFFLRLVDDGYIYAAASSDRCYGVVIRVGFHTLNVRDVEGCDDSAAIDAVESGTRSKLEAWADERGYAVLWNRNDHSRDTRTFVVACDGPDAGWRTESDIAEMLDAWSDGIIADGDW